MEEIEAFVNKLPLSQVNIDDLLDKIREYGSERFYQGQDSMKDSMYWIGD